MGCKMDIIKNKGRRITLLKFKVVIDTGQLA